MQNSGKVGTTARICLWN